MEPTIKTNRNLGIGIGVLVILIIIFILISSDKKPSIEPTTENTSLPVNNPIVPNTLPVSNSPSDLPKNGNVSSLYKDGTYSAVGSYMSPGGLDKIGVTVTLVNDIVSTVSLELKPGDDTSEKYQNIFATSYKDYVIGKSIDTLKLDKVSRSSLTSRGFNDAITNIKLQAKA